MRDCRFPQPLCQTSLQALKLINKFKFNDFLLNWTVDLNCIKVNLFIFHRINAFKSVKRFTLSWGLSHLMLICSAILQLLIGFFPSPLCTYWLSLKYCYSTKLHWLSYIESFEDVKLITIQESWVVGLRSEFLQFSE